MFQILFNTILRSVGIPVVSFLVLENTILSSSQAFLAVAITLSIVSFLSIVFQLVRILPSALMLKGKKVFYITIRILIEMISVVGFWLYYIDKY